MSISDFSLWFQAGCYGGLVCCMLAIALNGFALLLGRRERMRQAFWTTAGCVLMALLMVPALLWFQNRFLPLQTRLEAPELTLMLILVTFCGWVLPLSATVLHFLFAPIRTVSDPLPMPERRRTVDKLQPPRYQSGVQAPFVFSDDVPWGWLEYRSGKFQGQRLALKRTVTTLGRDGNCDIWIDDEMASRHHAELAWDHGRVCLTDNNSLNGTLVNGKRIRGTVQLSSSDQVEIGGHRFLFMLAQRAEGADDDPLTRHTWRSTQDLQSSSSGVLPPANLLLEDLTVGEQQMSMTPPDIRQAGQAASVPPPITIPELEKGSGGQHEGMTPPAEPALPGATSTGRHTGATPSGPQPLLPNDTTTITPPPLPITPRALRVLDGSLKGHSFLLNRPQQTVGRSEDCDWMIPDAAAGLASLHARIICKPEGDYVEDLTGGRATLVNEMLLWCPQLLKPGDIVSLGAIRLEYLLLPETPATPLSPSGPVAVPASLPPRSMGGPAPLKLPSRRKG